jgi:hypothetical protein
MLAHSLQLSTRLIRLFPWRSSAIPTEPQGGNHTAAFAKAAISEAAHSATMAITKGLALTGYRILTDTAFFDKVNEHSFPDRTLFLNPIFALSRLKHLSNKAKRLGAERSMFPNYLL